MKTKLEANREEKTAQKPMWSIEIRRGDEEYRIKIREKHQIKGTKIRGKEDLTGIIEVPKEENQNNPTINI